MKFKAKTMIVTRKNLFIKEPTALKQRSKKGQALSLACNGTQKNFVLD